MQSAALKAAVHSLLLLIALPCRAGEGFGMLTKVVAMERTSPPQLVLPVRQIALAFHDPGGKAAALRQRIESEIQAGDPQMKIAADAPYVVTVEVRDYLTGNTQAIHGTLRVTDRAGRTLYDGPVSASNAGAIVAASDDKLISEAAADVVRIVAVQRHHTAVVVPKGRLDDFIPLAERGDWAGYLTALERMPARKDDADPYREYALAIAHEGVAHQTTDLAAKVRHLREAVAHNLAAARAKPSEPLFSEQYAPLRRAFDTPGLPPKIWVDPHTMERWESMLLVRTWMAAPPAGAGTLDNRGVLQRFAEGRSDTDILAAVEHAPHVQFALGRNEMTALSQAGVPWPVIDAMRTKTGLGRREFWMTPDSW